VPISFTEYHFSKICFVLVALLIILCVLTPCVLHPKLMKLRSYGPDTEESKARTVGMYKSPAYSAKKPRTPKRKAVEAAGIAFY